MTTVDPAAQPGDPAPKGKRAGKSPKSGKGRGADADLDRLRRSSPEKARRKAEKQAAMAAAQAGSVSDFIRGQGMKTVRRLLSENLRQHLPIYALAMVAMLVVAGTTAASAWIMKYVIDAMTAQNDTMVRAVAGAVVGIFAIKGLATYVQSVAMARAGNRIVATQQERLYDRLLRQGVAFFDERESSSLLLRVTQSANAARSLIDVVVTTLARDLITLVALVGVMVYQQPLLSGLVLVVGPLGYLVMRVLLGRMRSLVQQDYLLLGVILQVVQETARGIRVVKTFGLEDEMSRRMRRAAKAVERRANGIARVSNLSTPLLDTLSGVAIALVILVSTVQVAGLDRTTPGALMSFITALLMAYEPARRLARVRLQVEQNLAAIDRMYELMDAPQTLPEAADAAPLGDGPGEIRFEQVAFGFGTGAKAKSVLRGIDHVFPAGKMTALVGPSGGGKTTMLNLMLRLYDPDQGRVLIDGTDIRGATLASLRARMSFVAQDTFLFSDTIRENIRLGRRGASDAEVEAAARVAHAHDFIMALPQGYDTPVGENGAFLSGGQKQRLSIARAVVRRAGILLLDEATSALDTESEALVRDALDTIMKGVTSIVIAHRLTTILHADNICFIEGGRVAETGTLDELLALNGGFRRIYDQQFRDLKT